MTAQENANTANYVFDTEDVAVPSLRARLFGTPISAAVNKLS